MSESILDVTTVSVGAVQSFIEGEYGGPTEEEDEVYTLNAGTITRIRENDPERLALNIINLGSEAAYVLFSRDVGSDRGIILQPLGGYLALNVRDDQTLPAREWWATVVTGSTTIQVIATRRYALT